MSIFANNILVTGGAGYIGSHIVELLIKNNSKVFIYYKNQNKPLVPHRGIQNKSRKGLQQRTVFPSLF